jgi:hypothetical protein
MGRSPRYTLQCKSGRTKPDANCAAWTAEGGYPYVRAAQKATRARPDNSALWLTQMACAMHLNR